MDFSRGRLARTLSRIARSSEGRMLQDYKLGLRMLLKYPGLTSAGGLALAIAIAIGAGETVTPLVMSVRVRGNPAPLVARLPVIATAVDAGLSVQEAQSLDQWRSRQAINFAAVLGAVTSLVLFLSALGIFSLLSVSVSRRTREIGLRAALGANPRHVLFEILSRAVVLMGTGIAIGGGFLLLLIAAWEEDVALYAGWLGITCAVMFAVGAIACIEPARRALRISPTDALRQV